MITFHDRLSRHRGRLLPCAGRGAARGDDAGGEGRPAQPVLLLQRSRGVRRVVAAEAQRGRGRAGPWRLRIVAVPDRPGRDQPAAASGRRGSPARHPGPVRVRRHPRAAHDLPGPDRHGRVVGPRGDRARTGGRRPRVAGGRHPLDLRTDGRHRARPAVGTDRRGGRRGPLSSAPPSPWPRSAASRERITAHRSGSSPGPSTSPATGRRWAGGTTTRSTCPTTSCGTSTSRRSRPRSRPGPAT